MSRVALLKGGHLFAHEVLLSNLALFRRHPAKFLSSKRISPDDFVHGLLQALYDDDIAEERKVQLLAILHEFDQVLLSDSTRLEHVLATLLAMLVRGSATNYTFKGEVLITSTAIMIQHDFLTVQPKTLGRFIDSLFKIIQGSNSSQDAHYRRTACQCLHEFELCFPGCLARKLGHLAKLCTDESTFAAEAYAVLLAVALRNAVLLINQQQDDAGLGTKAADGAGGSSINGGGGGGDGGAGVSDSGTRAADAAGAGAGAPARDASADGAVGGAAGDGGGDEGAPLDASDTNRDAASPDVADGPPQTLDDLLLTDSENLLPYNESAVARSTALATFDGHEGRVAYNRLDSSGSPENITSAVAFLMDNVGLLNPPAMLAVVCALAECALSASVKPQVFTRAYLAMLSSKDMICVHVLVILHLWYGEEVVTNGLDANAVANKLLFGLNGSGLSGPDCAVSLAWLQGCPGLLPTGVGEAVTRDARGCLLPRVFDSPEVMARKIGVLAELCRGFAAANSGDDGSGSGSSGKRKKGGGKRRGGGVGGGGDDGDNADGAEPSSAGAYDTATFLMEALVCFADHTAYQPTDRPVLALFQSLYLLYAEGMLAAGSRDGARLCEDTYSVLLKTVSKCPKFVMNAVDVGECVYANHPADASHAGRPLLLALLEEFTAAMVNSTDAELLANLSHHLVLLGRLAKEVSISPGPYIDRLHALLTTSDICSNGDWNLGGDLLNVCRMLIYAQPTAVILRPLGNLLRYVWVAHGDIDIRDNARFYYMLLTNVAGEPLSQILKPHETTRSSLSSMMTDNMLSSSKYQPADPISAVSTTFLVLERKGPGVAGVGAAGAAGVDGDRSRGGGGGGGGGGGDAGVDGAAASVDQVALGAAADDGGGGGGSAAAGTADDADGSADADTVALKQYEAWFAAFAADATLRLRFELSFRPDADVAPFEPPLVLYAVSLGFDKHARLHEMPAVTVPLLRHGHTAEVVVELRPKDPAALTIGVSVEYNTPGSVGLLAPMNPIKLKFGDFMCPLPVPTASALGPASGSASGSASGPGASALASASASADSQGNGSLFRMSEVFPVLWSALKRREGGLQSECMQTVIRIRTAVTMDKVEDVLGRFLIDASGGSSVADSDGCRKQRFLAAAVLLPDVQLLMEGTISEGLDECSIHLITDNFKCLPFVEQHLQEQFGAFDSSGSR